MSRSVGINEFFILKKYKINLDEEVLKDEDFIEHNYFLEDESDLDEITYENMAKGEEV